MRFMKALISDNKHKMLPEEDDIFGRLIGSWKIEYIDNETSRVYKGEWHFTRMLDGMAVQDVIILPDYEYGTTLRLYNPETRAWDVAYCYTGKIMRLEAKKQDDKIVLAHLDDLKRKWIFVNIGDNEFHWQDASLKNDGKWQSDFDIYAERI